MKKPSLNQIGDIGELKFILEATSKGFITSKPFGNCMGYDMVLDNGKRLFKVQVKAGNAGKSGQVHFKISAFKAGLEEAKHKFDVLVCYDLTSDSVYILPSVAVTAKCISLYRGNSKLTKYKNKWSVFK